MAPRVFFSYTHDSESHRTSVHELARRLRHDGIDVRLDRWVEGTPIQGWPSWMEDEVQAADFVIIVCSARYYERYRGRGNPTQGRGGRWESNLIRDELYADRSRLRRYVPVLAEEAAEEDVPDILRHSVTRYRVETEYEELYRFLTGQPVDSMPPLGTAHVMPARAHNAVGAADGRVDRLSAAGGGELALPLVVGQIPGRPRTYIDRASALRLAHEFDQTDVVVVTALTGMRGVGKTQVAAAFARQAVERGLRLVAWVNADSTENLISGLARVAERASLTDRQQDPEESAHLLREHLAVAKDQSVLVLDNATDPETVWSLIPTTGNCKVVITSTDRRFDVLAHVIDVSTYDRPESVRYLTESTGLTDEAGAHTVADELGDLPLALASVSSYIRHGHIGYAQCLADLRAYPVTETLSRINGIGYPATTAAALLLAVDSVDTPDDNHAAGSLLEIIATLSAEGVSRELLYRASNDGGRNWTPRQVDRALERCVTGSVLSWSDSGESVIMHRLMSRVIRERAGHLGRWGSAVSGAMRVLEPELDLGGDAWRSKDAGLQAVNQIRALTDAVLHEDSPDLGSAQDGAP